ncbi:hypothetical protein PTSG_07153 [Salpingoeca rosetta]|uniref:Membrane-associated protein n=1 Tax=Salpingoeca rosetta (strain ATCC 50818 / BSB-021) TaxID=946362 RepID=F2UE78_SALR5|nr:uncharacterized protein PTSG_07153 [Salpingoeca rosetta]EGD74928.1 hypothetical protein PTSG_07153 [Salpingoeca rosetta]|eukprot:XP_004992573.1 hypothetical protein PTSG_07153 [Salpingoeca rosetta]
MSSGSVLCSVFVCVLVVAAATAPRFVGGEQHPPRVVVQGMDFQWRHRIAGFETPHRLGNLQWEASASKCSPKNVSTVSSSMTFTPGVDGDYAFPLVRFAVVESQDSDLIREKHVHVSATDHISPSSPASVDNVTTFSTTGRGDSDEAPSARVTMLANVSFPSATSTSSGGTTHQQVLGGVNLRLACVNDKAAGCDVCNSNGAWFSVFSIKLQQCKHDTCVLNATFERGWTPSHGGGKPLSSCLHYNLTAQVLSVAVKDVFTDSLTYTTSLFTVPANVTRHVPLQPDTLPRMLAGVRGVEFNLTATSKHPQRGRYFERFTFGVTQPRTLQRNDKAAHRNPRLGPRNQQEGGSHKGNAHGNNNRGADGTDGARGDGVHVVYDASCAVTSPAVTTYPINVTYALHTAVMILARPQQQQQHDGVGGRSTVQVPASGNVRGTPGGASSGVFVSGSRTARGVVCEDDAITAFHCSQHNLPAQLTSHVQSEYACRFSS